jgi:hypothetical protein
MATIMINRCTKSYRVEKLVSWSYFSYFAAAATTHCSPMMFLPGRRAQQPICREGCHTGGSNANKDAHRHLVGRVSPITWHETLHIPT